MHEISGRNFLRIGAAAMIAASYSRILGANDVVQLGRVGYGRRGCSVMRAFLSTRQVLTTGLCDIWGGRARIFATAATYLPRMWQVAAKAQ